MVHLILSLTEIQWKLKQPHDQWMENHYRTNTSLRRMKEIQKSRSVRVTVMDPSRKVNHLRRVI